MSSLFFVYYYNVCPNLSVRVFWFITVFHMSRSMTKPTKWTVCPAETPISLGIHPVWSVFTVRPMGSQRTKLSSCGQWRLIRLGLCPGWSESSLGTHGQFFFLFFFSLHFLTCKWAATLQNQQWGICPVWSESSLSARRKLGSLATHLAHSEDSDQTGRMPRLIWVFAVRMLILLVLSCRGSNYVVTVKILKHYDTRKICCNYPKIWTMWLYLRVMRPKGAEGIANSADLDLLWVYTVCSSLSENLGT